MLEDVAPVEHVHSCFTCPHSSQQKQDSLQISKFSYKISSVINKNIHKRQHVVDIVLRQPKMTVMKSPAIHAQYLYSVLTTKNTTDSLTSFFRTLPFILSKVFQHFLLQSSTSRVGTVRANQIFGQVQGELIRTHHLITLLPPPLTPRPIRARPFPD